MKLDKHVVDMFTELTKPADDVKMEKTCYGTISVVDGTRYVKLDGSDLLVPAASTVKTSHGDRVTVLMKNHSLTVTGNLTAPATDGEGGSSGGGGAGTAATIEVGTVTTGEAGSSAAVTNSGTTSAAVFDFVIPRGDKGEKGDTGPQGPQGEKGDTGTWDGTIPDHEHTVSDITDFPTSLPANGGNADTVDGKHASDFSQVIDFGDTPTDTKTAIGIPHSITTYRCTSWTDYPAEAADGQGIIIAASYYGAGIVGTDPMRVRQLFITPHYNYKIWQRIIAGTTIGEWTNAANGGNADIAQYIGTWGGSEEYYGKQLKMRALYNKFGDSRFGLTTDTDNEIRVDYATNADTVGGKSPDAFFSRYQALLTVDYVSKADMDTDYKGVVDSNTANSIGLDGSGNCWWHIIGLRNSNDDGYGTQLAIPLYPGNSNQRPKYRTSAGTTFWNWKNLSDGGNAASVGAYTEAKLTELEARIAALEGGTTR